MILEISSKAVESFKRKDDLGKILDNIVLEPAGEEACNNFIKYAALLDIVYDFGGVKLVQYGGKRFEFMDKNEDDDKIVYNISS